jgi:serine/threonine protein kinase/WD40 repeat protein
VAPERRDRISSLHDAALACAPAERGAFLTEACEGDDDLRREVESLLAYESAAVRFLETPAADVMAVAFGSAPAESMRMGRQLGPYTILAPLGAGGMGEVYRAHDSKLGRDVAVKILPSHFTADPERRSRFAREARLLATLNHPHVGAIYGLEEIDGVTALILELLEGPTLADRLAHGPLPIADALAIARQIAEALEAAHEKGIVHRDLKPANIVLQRVTTASGVPSSDARAKVLDFGLAKTIVPGLDGDLAGRPAGSFDGTMEGRILGTPAYMSPEQARGRVVDKRTDIWSFACILYEMLSGRRAFDGDTISDTFVSILEHEPEWTALPAATPPYIRTLLERCLRKDPRTRLHDIADALIEFEDATRPLASTTSVTGAAPGMWHPVREGLGWIVAAALVVALSGTMLLNRRHVPPPAPPLVEFPILPPEGSKFTKPQVEFAVSPDGRHVAFIANSKTGSSLWVRSLTAIDPRPLRGTEGARNPFWSPDSQSIGFFADNQLKTVLASGVATVVPFPGSESFAPISDALGGAPSGTWSSQEIVVYGPSQDGSLRQINLKSGGMPTPVTTRETSVLHRRPKFLPDGRRFLYLAGQREQRVGSLTTADTIVIGTFDSPVVYSAGHLLFARGENLMAQPFNEETLRLEGNAVPVRVQVSAAMPGFPIFSASSNGPLVFLPPATTEPQLAWLDRDGRRVGLVGNPGLVGGSLDLSPDGEHVAFFSHDAGGHSGIWLMEVATGKATPLSEDATGDTDAAWSPDGKQLVFNSGRLGGLSLFLRASDGSGVDVPVAKYEKSVAKNFTVASWSRAGGLIFNAYDESADSDLWTLSMSGDRTPSVFLSSKHSEMNGAFSPDDRWVAYQTNASGRYEVVVRPYPNKEPAQTISHDGGKYPRWRGDGKELFFVSPDGTMMAADFDAATGRSRGVPQRLFATQIRFGDNRPYAVDSSGQRFLLRVAPDPRLIAVTDWRALLPR